ncbi:MAG: hypothetical protein VW712_14590, partial [Paracoccaceae bacterium]
TRILNFEKHFFLLENSVRATVSQVLSKIRAAHPPPSFLFSIIFFYIPAIKVAVSQSLVPVLLLEPAKNLEHDDFFLLLVSF